ncbi:phosphatidylglycerophosphatase A family protein [Aquibaculum arenosum]|uniref:Phosphatidylglycerophosphatase A n=1 Tax=Aquibaculum arenosum TaxID=3032591 RepID=A0ABT5YMN9_9PROT|nr:phosphatidylglycerophosphatase A [Fodinicurvata sp. CAU 1616]MDF2096173.1 phosphatidylglycerophosphatase A [Fodinicurvata sp. CAU 1616]
MKRLAFLLATWFGSGRLPGPSGTWGSLAALPPAAALVWLGGPWLLALATLAIVAAGWWSSEVYTHSTQREDPSEVVIDEVAGQWMPLVVLPFHPWAWLAAFIAFRLFDILKPWPVSWADRRLPGGLGIMADDLLAGLYAALLLGFLWPYLEI